MHNDVALIAACALFGFSVGNLITLPALIVQREFDPRSFGVLISLITAINQITYAFGPGVVGLLRDFSGSYALPFYCCIAIELTAAVLIMIRGQIMPWLWIASRSLSSGAHSCDPVAKDGEARSKSSRSSRFVNIESLPSGARGHSASGRSRYSSTPFSSGSRR